VNSAEHHCVTVKTPLLVAVPPAVVIAIFPVFAPMGTIAITCVSEFTVKLVAFTPLQHNCPFRELGADYYQRLRAPSLSQSLVRPLQRLGHQVTFTPAQQAI
jgi:hypothetical protein